MITQRKLHKLTRAENKAYVAYLEAHEQANAARKEWALHRLKERGITLNKTFVWVYNYNLEKVRAKVRSVTNEGKAICFEIDQLGRCIKPNRQAACVDPDAVDLTCSALEE